MAMIRNSYSFVRLYLNYRKEISLPEFSRYRKSLCKVNSKNIIEFKLKRIKSKFNCRQQASDLSIFRDFFLKTDYAATLPGAKRIIDAGANIGAATVLFKKRYPDAEIIALEPDDSNCEMFALNTKSYTNVTLINGGLASEHGKKMRIKDKTVPSYSFELVYDSEGLDSFSVDGLMKDNNWEIIDIVKIDIEGGERELFSANINWIKKTRQIIIELHDYKLPGCSRALIDAFSGLNFNINFSGENLILTNVDLLGT